MDWFLYSTGPWPEQTRSFGNQAVICVVEKKKNIVGNISILEHVLSTNVAYLREKKWLGLFWSMKTHLFVHLYE